MQEMTWERARDALAGLPLPSALLDLDALEANTDRILEMLDGTDKTLRVATKSLRCRDVLRRIAERGGERVRGLMAYSAVEAAWLVEHGATDVFVAYPTGRPHDARLLAEANAGEAEAGIVVDCAAHLDLLDAAARDAGTVIPVVVEIDVSWRPFGGHIGVLRSPLRSVEAVVDLARDAEQRGNLRFLGVMGYEAHIAGLQDDNPFSPLLNAPKRWLRRAARGPVATLRARLAEALDAAGLGGRLFNGGGTGSVAWTAAEAAVTEVTAGSGFVAPALFDYFAHLRDQPLRPALSFAVQVARIPQPGWVTVHGGGWVASGEAGPDKLPVPWLPQGLTLRSMEGAGEVQTPLRVPHGVQLAVGDPVLFRHAKAGELCEHVNELHLLRGGEVVDVVPTYRGEGRCFLG